MRRHHETTDVAPTVDAAVPDELLDQMREAVGADLFRQIEIVEP